MNLKIGGSNVGKIMYNGQEFGSQKLEPGTILYMSGIDFSYLKLADGTIGAHSTAEIIFPNVGKHWEGLKSIRIYYNNLYITSSGQVFDVNSIDEPTHTQGDEPLTFHRERSLTDEADKLIVTTDAGSKPAIVITVEEWN